MTEKIQNSVISPVAAIVIRRKTACTICELEIFESRLNFVRNFIKLPDGSLAKADFETALTQVVCPACGRDLMKKGLDISTVGEIIFSKEEAAKKAAEAVAAREAKKAAKQEILTQEQQRRAKVQAALAALGVSKPTAEAVANNTSAAPDSGSRPFTCRNCRRVTTMDQTAMVNAEDPKLRGRFCEPCANLRQQDVYRREALAKDRAQAAADLEAAAGWEDFLKIPEENRIFKQPAADKKAKTSVNKLPKQETVPSTKNGNGSGTSVVLSSGVTIGVEAAAGAGLGGGLFNRQKVTYGGKKSGRTY